MYCAGRTLLLRDHVVKPRGTAIWPSAEAKQHRHLAQYRHMAPRTCPPRPRGQEAAGQLNR